MRATGIAIATAGAVLGSVGLARAATLGVVSADPGPYSLRYTAVPGEVNDFTLERWRRFDDLPEGFALPFAEVSAPLTLGAGCTQMPPRCVAPFGSGTTVSVLLGDRDDRADVQPFDSSSYVWGEQGNDAIVSNGNNDGYASGGPGNDSVRSSAEIRATSLGGPGDDSVGGGAPGYVDLYGDAGNDLLVLYGGFLVTMDGGTGSDTIVAQGVRYTRTRVDAGPGDDVVVVAGATAEVSGGAGNDMLTGGAGTDSLRGDGGDDVIDAAGDPGTVDTVSCGSGRDTVRADPDDQIASDCEQRLQAATAIRETTQSAVATAERRARPVSRALAREAHLTSSSG